MTIERDEERLSRRVSWTAVRKDHNGSAILLSKCKSYGVCSLFLLLRGTGGERRMLLEEGRRPAVVNSRR